MENEKSAIANRDNGRTLPEIFRTLLIKTKYCFVDALIRYYDSFVF